MEIHADHNPDNAHGYSHRNSCLVGPTYQGAGKRMVFVTSCKCGWYSTNSASVDSADKKFRKHLESVA